MASIGSVSCDTVGVVNTAGDRLESESHRAPGADGEQTLFLGLAPGEFHFRAFKEFSGGSAVDDAYTWFDDLEAVQTGEATVTITDDQGKAHANCLVKEVRRIGPERRERGGALYVAYVNVTGTFQ